MKLISRTSSAVLALATVTALSMSSAFADTATLTQMQDQLRGELQSVGITDVDFSTLTFAQVADLSALFDQKDASARAAAEAILQAPARAATGKLSTRNFPQAQELVAMVTNDLRSVGIEGRNLDKLSIGELQDLAAVFSKDEPGSPDLQARVMAVLDAHQRDRAVMRTVADFPKAAEMARIVNADLGSLGIKVAHPEKLTLEQLSQISAAFDSTDSAATRAAAVNRILGVS
ncbi:hypothetical protein [Frigidibacter sp. ROC022]|uniref:hypothetical protein n=1 Tax=Frigidibacter sp. ROC022 TaxID=2971796 RepID=UPI00215A35C9|nr:hypothetical protein [Frigidibacter sp. ROC022]MCR8725726.1 hypothetical protein [Frigidibacter sp. ROC022]